MANNKLKNNKFKGVLVNPFFFPPMMPDTTFYFSRQPVNMPDVALIGLASSAKPYQIDVIDGATSEINFEQFISQVSKYNLVGIRSVASLSSLQVHALITAVKTCSPKTFVVLGGHHATMYYEKWFELVPELDAIICGEGEITFKELVEALALNKSISQINGLVFKNSNNEIKYKGQRSLIKNLDSLPLPDFDMQDHKKYYIPLPGSGGAGTIETSRGCSNSCGFCAVSAMWNKCQRFKSVNRVLTEIEILYKKGIRNIGFADDNFNSKPKMTIKLCDSIKKHFPELRWGAMVSARPYIEYPELASSMHEAGCRFVLIGFEYTENIAKETLKKGMNAAVETGEYRKIYKTLNSLGTTVMGFFIYGFKGETKNELLKMSSITYKLCHFRGMKPYEVIHGTPDYPLLDNVQTGDFYRNIFLCTPPVQHSLPTMLQIGGYIWFHELWSAISGSKSSTNYFFSRISSVLKAFKPVNIDQFKFSKIIYNVSKPKSERLEQLVNETISSAKAIGLKYSASMYHKPEKNING